MSGTEVTALLNEMGATIGELQQSDRQSLERLLKHIGKIAEDPASEEDARIVAEAGQTWMEKLSGKILENLTVDNLIALGKAVAKGEISIDNLPS